VTTRDTVEEKILTRQNRKREIIQATIGGEEDFTASLKRLPAASARARWRT